MTMDALQVNLTINKVPLEPVRDKLARYESFLISNAQELQLKHGINMNKPTFIETI